MPVDRFSRNVLRTGSRRLRRVAWTASTFVVLVLIGALVTWRIRKENAPEEYTPGEASKDITSALSAPDRASWRTGPRSDRQEHREFTRGGSVGSTRDETFRRERRSRDSLMSRKLPGLRHSASSKGRALPSCPRIWDPAWRGETLTMMDWMICSW